MYGHDAQRTGYNPDETSINADNVTHLEMAWQVNLGIGDKSRPAFSAPVVVGDTVYVATSVSAGNNLFALNNIDGSLKWSASIGHNPDECFGVGIGSTPAVANNTLVIGGGDSAYYGFNAANGTLLWRDALDAGPSGFAWVSPFIANDRTYVGVASDCDNPPTRGEVRALDLNTGTHLGSLYMVPEDQVGADIWNSPALSEDGSTLFVTTGEDAGGYDGPYTRAIIALDATTFDVRSIDRQGVPNEDLDWATTPMIFHDGLGRILVGAGQKNGTFYAYNASDLSAGPIWEWSPGPNVGMLAAYDPGYDDGGILILGTRQGIFGLDPATGGGIWRNTSTGELHGSFAVANELIFANSDHNLTILDVNTGEVVHNIMPPESGVTFSGPAISRGMVYWMSGASLNAWRLPASDTKETELPQEPPANPSYTNPYYPCGDTRRCLGVL